MLINQSPAFLTSDDFVRSNEIVRKKWPIYEIISHFDIISLAGEVIGIFFPH